MPDAINSAISRSAHDYYTATKRVSLATVDPDHSNHAAWRRVKPTLMRATSTSVESSLRSVVSKVSTPLLAKMQRAAQSAGMRSPDPMRYQGAIVSQGVAGSDEVDSEDSDYEAMTRKRSPPRWVPTQEPCADRDGHGAQQC